MSLHGTPGLENVKGQKVSAGVLWFFFAGGPASVLPWFGTADPSEALRVPENP